MESSFAVRRGKQQARGNTRKHTRVLTACDACRLSKTRCDSARPICAKCIKRGVSCEYPDKDPLSILETWGSRILEAVERQENLLAETLAANQNNVATLHRPQQDSTFPSLEEEDPESISRNDVLKTPITGSDMILSWPIFSEEKPVTTFPASAFSEKADRFQPGIPKFEANRMFELREIFLTKIWTKNPIVEADQLDLCIANVLDNGIDWSASSCLLLLVFALAAIWGNYPEAETRTIACHGPSFSRDTYISLSVPESRMKESLAFVSMARKRLSAAYLDESLVGVQCLCLFGIWYQYNIEPIPGWKVFRTASMLWQTYNLRHRAGETQRSPQEQSESLLISEKASLTSEGLEQRLYWTCLKSECEIRYELIDLPPCDLSLSDFPFSLPTFPMDHAYMSPGEMAAHSPSAVNSESISSYYYLAEISLRRLLNRVRNAVRVLAPDMDRSTMARLAETLTILESQLQQWVECLPRTLSFNPPLKLMPAPNEPELVKLARERYVEVRELLCRAYLYLCIHVPLNPEIAQSYGPKASEALLLSVYRIQTEVPFFRHPGSWGACRVRFNHALCLIAAFRAKMDCLPSMNYVSIPAAWADCVRSVVDRLRIWSEEGAGIKELCILLEWLMHGVVVG